MTINQPNQTAIKISQFIIPFLLLITSSLIISCNPSQQQSTTNTTIDTPQPETKNPAAKTEYEIDNDNLQKARPEIEAREIRITEEIKKLPKSELPENHWAKEWAGDYYVGDILGMNVSIMLAPKAGITYTWHGSVGLYDGNYGDIKEVIDFNNDGHPDGLKINWALHPTTGYDFDSENYYFIKWVEPNRPRIRRYLVPEEQMMEMVNDYNKGGFARDAMYSAPLKETQEQRHNLFSDEEPMKGFPRMPEKWAKLLLLENVDAQITHISPSETSRVTDGVDVVKTRITLNKGSADGVYIGLDVTLQLGSEYGTSGSLEIDKISEHTAEGMFRSYISPGKKLELPSVGETIRLIHGPDESNPDE